MTNNRRRFPRVTLQPALAEVFAGLSAQLTWSNHEVSDVLDLSYRGIAVRRPGLFPIALAAEVDVELRLGEFGPFAVNARVAWCTLEAAGLEFMQIEAEGHRPMAQYLDYKLLGSALKPVGREFLSQGVDFDHWYQGPSGVHVFVWEKASGQIERASVDLDGQTYGFERGVLPPSRNQRALLVLSQMDRADIGEFLSSFAR